MSKFDDGPVKPGSCRMYDADDKLKSKALRPGNAHDAIRQATQMADEAVEQLSIQFKSWMRDEAARLQSARRSLHTDGYDGERIERLFMAAHDIRGQAQTYGYPVAGAIARMLTTLIEKTPVGAKLPLPVIDQHVDAINAVVREDIHGNGDEQTDSLLKALQLLDVKTIQSLQTQASPIRKSA